MAHGDDDHNRSPKCDLHGYKRPNGLVFSCQFHKFRQIGSRESISSGQQVDMMWWWVHKTEKTVGQGEQIFILLSDGQWTISLVFHLISSEFYPRGIAEKKWCLKFWSLAKIKEWKLIVRNLEMTNIKSATFTPSYPLSLPFPGHHWHLVLGDLFLENVN